MSQTVCYLCGKLACGARDEEGWLCVDHAEPRGAFVEDVTQLRDRVPIVSNVRGVGLDGKPGDGAVSWEWRPPKAAPDKHHDTPIVVNKTLQFQQSPPVHVNGTAPKRAAGRGRPRGAVRVEAQHDVEAVLDAGLSDKERECYRLKKLVGLHRNEIAEKLGMTRTAVKKALERASGKVRKETLAL